MKNLSFEKEAIVNNRIGRNSVTISWSMNLTETVYEFCTFLFAISSK